MRHLVALLVLPALAAAGDRPDLLVADFEGDTYGDWTTTGTAFGTGPARGTLPDQMPVTGYVGKGLVYQNSFIYWFNHFNELGYDGPQYEVADGAIVVGGGLASIDVMKVLQLEGVRNALAEQGIDEDMEKLETEGIPAVLAEHGLSWERLNLQGATLYYRRRLEDMPLADGGDTTDPAKIARLENTRRKILEKAMQKYCFTVEPLRSPVSIIVKRSTPIPKPPVGGIPKLRASI